MVNMTNAQIKKTYFGKNDKSLLSIVIVFDFNESYNNILNINTIYNAASDTSWGLEFVYEVINVVGVDNWEKLKGKYCRVCFNADRQIMGIGNIIKDEWFMFDKEKDLYYKKRSNI